MTPETLDLFRAVVGGDASAVQRALDAGADVNATDGKGRNIASHAALGDAINAIDAPTQPRLSESRLEVLQLVLEHPDLSLYSLNAPLQWAGGVTLLGLMAWLNMPTEIMFLLEYTHGLVEVNAMDEQGATPLMYAARDGSLEVVQRLLAYGARPDLRDASMRSAIQYALPHPQILWLCEDAIRRERAGQRQSCSGACSSTNSETHSITSKSSGQPKDLFLATSINTIHKPPSPANFENADLHRTSDALLRATRAGDEDSLHKLLFAPESEIARPAMLINLRDASGLSLVHHAVSQRNRLDSPVLDALYRGGADVGLFSTLGFSPLHHLARTARDPPDAESDGAPLEAHPLHEFTTHLLRDLRAPLGATDAKGETPLHAAAEHGNSRLVLRAMLEYDAMYSGSHSVRELRNERGLRPVEVCRPEFVSLFDVAQAQAHLRPQHSWDSTLSKEQHDFLPAGAKRTGLPSTGRPRSTIDTGRPGSGRGSLTQMSNGSFESRSSNSSTSSFTKTHQLRPATQSRKPGTPLHTRALPTPSPTGTPLSEGPDAPAAFDTPAYTHDFLSNLALCASALHAYSQGEQETYETEYGELPDLSGVSDAILFTRDIGTLILEHWTAQLDRAREDFERARLELEKAQTLRENVCSDIIGRGNPTTLETKPDTYHGTNMSAVDARQVAVQTEVSAVYTTHYEAVTQLEQQAAARAEQVSAYMRLEDEEMQKPATPERATEMLQLMQDRRDEERRLRDVEDEIRLNRWYAESASTGTEIGASMLLGWVKRGSLGPLEIVHDAEEVGMEMVGREVRHKSDAKKGALQVYRTMPPEDALRSIPHVLQRVEKDLRGVVTQLAQVTQFFVRAQQSVAEASALVEKALKEREDRLQALVLNLPQPDSPHPPTAFRLPRIFEWSSDPSSNIAHTSAGTSTTQQLSPTTSSSSMHRRYIAASSPIDEPYALRRLLTRKIEKYMECVFDELQKAHVWLRIIREVLRGLRRRAAYVVEH